MWNRKSNATSKKYWPNCGDPFFEHCATLKNRDVGRLPKNFFFCPSQNLTSQFLTHNGLKSPENFWDLQTERFRFSQHFIRILLNWSRYKIKFVSIGSNLNYLYKNTYTRSSLKGAFTNYVCIFWHLTTYLSPLVCTFYVVNLAFFWPPTHH